MSDDLSCYNTLTENNEGLTEVNAKRWSTALLVLILLAAGACGKKQNAEAIQSIEIKPKSGNTLLQGERTPEPVMTEIEQRELIVVANTPSPTMTPMASPTPSPTPEPTPTPTASPIPFSYYAPTVNMSFEELVGGLEDTYYEANKTEPIWPKGYPATGTYRLVVDLYWQVVLAYKKDANGEYTVPVRYMLCTTADPKLGVTRTGIFPLKECRVRMATFAGGKFVAQYWTLLYSRTYFHSVVYRKKDLNSLYVDKYLKLGSRDSHGCIRLPVPDARWIWYNCAYGTEVEIRKGSKDDLETKAIRE